MDDRDGTTLLERLRELIERDSRPAFSSGRLAFGVKTESETTWLQVTCDRVVSTERITKPDANCDVVLLMGSEEARSILATGRLPQKASLLKLRGDRSLLARFVDRYLTHQSPLAVRR